jgi:hypothetical protein
MDNMEDCISHIFSLFNLPFFHIFRIFSLFNLLFFHIFHIISLFNLLFFRIFHIFSLFNLLVFHIFQIFPLFSSIFSISFHNFLPHDHYLLKRWKTVKLNSDIQIFACLWQVNIYQNPVQEVSFLTALKIEHCVRLLCKINLIVENLKLVKIGK